MTLQHGSTRTFSSMFNIVLLLCFLFCLFRSATSSALTLRTAIVLTRHGDRTPLKIFNNTLSKWPEGEGTLTPVGVRQHYELGTKYRHRYDKHNLVSPIFNDSEVLFRSTGKQRTLMSAFSFVNGFYPPYSGSGLPSGAQPVPIYSAETHNDHVLYAYKNCKQIKAIRKNERLKEQFQQKIKESEYHLRKLEEILGEPISLQDVSAIANIMQAEKIHGRPSLPALQNHTELIDFIIPTAEYVLRSKFCTPLMGKLGSGKLLRFMHDQLLAKIAGKGKNFILLSGHDGTILCLFAALNQFKLEMPHYAASVAFEFYENAENTTERYVKMFYSPHPEVYCVTKELKPVITWTFEEFTALVEDADLGNYDEVCAPTAEMTKKLTEKPFRDIIVEKDIV